MAVNEEADLLIDLTLQLLGSHVSKTQTTSDHQHSSEDTDFVVLLSIMAAVPPANKVVGQGFSTPRS